MPVRAPATSRSPRFTDLGDEELVAEICKRFEACVQTNELLEALRKLVSFLEHGRISYRGPAATKVAGRDIKAAVLRDVDGLTNREIGERLGVPCRATSGSRPTTPPCARW